MKTDVLAQLQAIVSSDDEFILRCDELIESWVEAGLGEEIVDPVLEFMEMNPEMDPGHPWGLIHFIEQFYSPSYRSKLIASIQRRPTAHTLLLLNRVLNGTDDRAEYDSLLAIMQAVRSHPLADQQALAATDGFLQFQARKVR